MDLLLDGLAVHTTATENAKMTRCGIQPKTRERVLRGLRSAGSICETKVEHWSSSVALCSMNTEEYHEKIN